MDRLYLRITLGVLVILVLAFSLPVVVFRILGRSVPRTESSGLMSGSAELLKDRLEHVPPNQLEHELDSLRAIFAYPLKLTDTSDESIPDELPESGIIRTVVSTGLLSHHRITYVPIANTDKILVMGPAPDLPRASLWSIITLVSVVLIIVGATGFLMIAPVIRNLRKLQLATSRFGEGNLDSRATVRSGDAVGIVARHFNRMADSIQGLIQRERQLLQSVSHELRTPIARIRFNLDMLNDATSREEQHRRIQEIDGEISEIDLLVGELLDFNRVHSEATQVEKQTMPIRPMLEEVTKRLYDFRKEIKVEFCTEGECDPAVHADQLLFRRAMQNLLSNAIRYAKTRVVVKYAHCDSVSVVEVWDDGPGIEPELRDRIMVPFYQAQNGHQSGGVGLGLAIVDRILQLHNGSISIDKAEIGGARFITRWPDEAAQMRGDG